MRIKSTALAGSMVQVQYTKGFTLVEVVMALSIIIALSGGFFLSGGKGRDTVKVQRAAVQLESALKEAQALGNSGRAFYTSTETVGDASLADEVYDRGYGVHVPFESNTFYMYGGNGDGVDSGGTPDAGEDRYDETVASRYETIVFDGGVTVSDIVFDPAAGTNKDADVLFRRGESDVKIHRHSGGGTYKNSVTFTLTLGSVESKVVVNKQGLIYIEE